MIFLEQSKQLNLNQKQAVFKLWNLAYPVNIRHEKLENFELYLESLEDQNHILLIDENDLIVGWYFDFIREDARWFAMILDPQIQRKGWGGQLLRKAQKAHTTLLGWVIDHDNDIKSDGLPYQSPLEFYLNNGFELLSDIRLETDNISAVKIRWTH